MKHSKGPRGAPVVFRPTKGKEKKENAGGGLGRVEWLCRQEKPGLEDAMKNKKSRTFLALIVLTLVFSSPLASWLHTATGVGEDLAWGLILASCGVAWACLHIALIVQHNQRYQRNRLEAGLRPETRGVLRRRRSERRQRKRNDRVTWKNRGWDG